MPPPTAAGGFGLLDWLALGGYFAVVAAVGLRQARWASSAGGGARVPGRESDEFFLGGRHMPVWAVSISVLATSLSAATFIGGPQQAYSSDLTYVSANVGAVIAVVIVAWKFLPAFYRFGVTSVYELLGHELGPRARTAAGAAFLVGRVFASGARLYIVAIPFALVAFGDLSSGALVGSICVIAAVATVYTAAGGIRAVIWTDVLQAVVVIGTVTLAFVILAQKIPVPAGELVDALRDTETGDKLRWINTDLDLSNPFTIWAALVGFVLFNLAAFGTDQDLTQRMLTCRSARKGATSVIVSQLIGIPVVLLFMALGLLLFVYYQRPDLMGAVAPTYAVDDTRRVFLEFILAELPTGLRGLLMAGLFAAAMSSLDSALNAMASSTVADFYRPLARRRAARIASPSRAPARTPTRARAGTPPPTHARAGDSGADDPDAAEPSAGDPSAGDPSAGDPSAGDPSAGDPSAGDPSAGDPSAGDPSAGDPSAGDPSAGDPSAGDPSAGDPSAGDPSAGDPSAGDPGAGRELLVSRFAILGWAVALAGFASLCVFWQRASSENLIPFALGVMVFAYAGLVGVFLTVLFTRTRGSDRSAMAAIATGFLVVLGLQDFALAGWLDLDLAFPWKMTLASAASFAVCCVGRDRRTTAARGDSVGPGV